MDYLFLWLRRLIDAIDRKVDAWWRDRPLADEEAARLAKHQMRRELSEAVGEWERSANASGGDGE